MGAKTILFCEYDLNIREFLARRLSREFRPTGYETATFGGTRELRDRLVNSPTGDVAFVLVGQDNPLANRQFVIRSSRELYEKLSKEGIPFCVYSSNPELRTYAKGAGAVRFFGIEEINSLTDRSLLEAIAEWLPRSPQ